MRPEGPAQPRFDDRHLSRALEAARMGVWWWDVGGGEVYWSAQMERIFGLEPGTFEGTVSGYIDRVHPEDQPAARARTQEILSGSLALTEVRQRIVRADGLVRWVDVCGAVERDGGGRAVAVLGTAQDVTERVRAQDALQVVGDQVHGTGQDFFRALVRGLGEILGIRCVLAGELVAPTRVRAVAVWAGDAVEGFEFDHVATPCRDVFARNECVYVEDVQRAFPGVPLLAQLDAACYLGQPLRAAGGDPLGVLAVIHDAPLEDVEVARRILQSFAARAQAELQRLRFEVELQESAAQLKQAQHLAKMGIWEWDVPSDRTTWSDEMLPIYGITREAFTGKGSDYLEFTHPDDRARQQENLKASFARAAAQARSQGAPVEVVLDPQDLRIVRPDGSVCYARGDAVAVVDDQGRPLRMLGVLLDVTEQKQLEQQLLQAQKLETVGRLAGGIAHDFNNLLTAMLSSAELALLRVDRADPELRELLDTVKAAAQRGGELTTQLLSFARKQVLQLEELDLDERLRAAATGLLTRLIGAHIDLRLDLRSGAQVKADAGQLDQVLLNLVVNARDAMPDGGTLTIASARAGDDVVWSVQDTGCGIPAELQERVFEPFFTTKGPGEGTGLGLSTCFGIVAQHGGGIELESAPDQGTTFRVRLPACASVVPAAQDRAESPGPPATGDELILLVEDEPTVRRLVEILLRDRGYRVLSAADGEDALALAARTPRIDLLLTDVVMPRLGGPLLATRLQAERPDLKVLFMSGYADADLRVQGGVHLIHKPYSTAELAQRVRAVLDG